MIVPMSLISFCMYAQAPKISIQSYCGALRYRILHSHFSLSPSGDYRPWAVLMARLQDSASSAVVPTK